MKKFLAIIFALALVMSLSVPVFATDYDETDTGGQIDLTFTYTAATPAYTVTIPATLTLGIGDTQLPITVSDSENLGGKKIEVVFVKSSGEDVPGGWITWLKAQVGPILYFIGYDIYDADNVKITTAMGAGWTGGAPGTLLADFTADGTKNIKINIDPAVVSYSGFRPGVAYTGNIQFGIALA